MRSPAVNLDARRLEAASLAAALMVAFTCVLNAYGFTLTTANPLVQSDVWRFLDGFLGRFIEFGFSMRDVFVEPSASDANFPYYKLLLMANAHWFGLDMSLEGVLAAVSAIACVLFLGIVAADRPLRRWRAREGWLLAVLALTMLSLNSPNYYGWPLAMMWYVPVLASLAFLAFTKAAGWKGMLVAAFCMGVLFDEFAIPVVCVAMLVRAAFGYGSGISVRAPVLAVAAGLALSRLFYWAWNLSGPTAGIAEGMSQSWNGLFVAEAWKAVLVPLSDSIAHQAHFASLQASRADLLQVGIGLALLVAHGWFWWRAMIAWRSGERDRALHLAISTMLFFYAMVAGLVLQRVPEYGFEYLHQPRYVLFYQLNLAALAILIYRQVRMRTMKMRGLPAMPTVLAIVALCVLQLRFSATAWDQVQYGSTYHEQAARDIGRLAADPGGQLSCVPYVRVCEYPEDKRRRIMGLLVRHRLNLFSPEFQAFHRLYPQVGPTLPPPQPAAAPQPR